MRLTIIMFIITVVHLQAMSQELEWNVYNQTFGDGVTIQNGFPKGGVRYTDLTGKNFGYIIFWSRILNKASTPVEVTIQFPADSFAIPDSENGYFKLFVTPDTMTFAKQVAFNYGLTDLTLFFHDVFYKSTELKRIIRPGEESAIYIAMASRVGYKGAVRTGLMLKDKKLFYQTNILAPELIPCGKIEFIMLSMTNLCRKSRLNY